MAQHPLATIILAVLTLYVADFAVNVGTSLLDSATVDEDSQLHSSSMFSRLDHRCFANFTATEWSRLG